MLCVRWYLRFKAEPARPGGDDEQVVTWPSRSGMSAQGGPVRSREKIPFRTFRSPTRGAPRDLLGNSGRITAPLKIAQLVTARGPWTTSLDLEPESAARGESVYELVT